jgi:hypothetical protein
MTRHKASRQPLPPVYAPGICITPLAWAAAHKAPTHGQFLNDLLACAVKRAALAGVQPGPAISEGGIIQHTWPEPLLSVAASTLTWDDYEPTVIEPAA